jgi:hypothetical protein
MKMEKREKRDGDKKGWNGEKEASVRIVNEISTPYTQ